MVTYQRVDQNYIQAVERGDERYLKTNAHLPRLTDAYLDKATEDELIALHSIACALEDESKINRIEREMERR